MVGTRLQVSIFAGRDPVFCRLHQFIQISHGVRSALQPGMVHQNKVSGIPIASVPIQDAGQGLLANQLGMGYIFFHSAFRGIDQW